MIATLRPSATQQPQVYTLAHARMDTPVMARHHVKRSTFVLSTMVIALGSALRLVLVCVVVAARLVRSLKQVQTLSAAHAHLALGRAMSQILCVRNAHVEKARTGCKVPALPQSAAHVLQTLLRPQRDQASVSLALMAHILLLDPMHVITNQDIVSLLQPILLSPAHHAMQAHMPLILTVHHAKHAQVAHLLIRSLQRRARHAHTTLLVPRVAERLSVSSVLMAQQLDPYSMVHGHQHQTRSAAQLSNSV